LHDREIVVTVTFIQYDLGHIDLEQKTLQPLDNPFGPRLSPMSSVRIVTHVSGPYKKSLARPAGFEPTTPWFVLRSALSN